MKISQSSLSSLGLSAAESAVYLAALELGESSIQELSRKSGVKRTSIYNFIDRLKERQIIAETRKGKRNVFVAVHPEQLYESLKMRTREFERILPELRAVHNRSRKKPKVTFYEEVSGLLEIYADALAEKKPISAWTDWEHIIGTMGEGFLRDYPRERARQGIVFEQITKDSPTAREVARRDKEEKRVTKFLDTRELKTEIMIYGNKVSIMSFRSSPPFGILIEDAGIAETLRVGWQQLWKRL